MLSNTLCKSLKTIVKVKHFSELLIADNQKELSKFSHNVVNYELELLFKWVILKCFNFFSILSLKIKDLNCVLTLLNQNLNDFLQITEGLFHVFNCKRISRITNPLFQANLACLIFQSSLLLRDEFILIFDRLSWSFILSSLLRLRYI